MKNLIKPIQTAGNDRGAGARRTTVKFIALLTLLNWAVVLDFVSAAETPGQQQAAQATAIPWNEIGAAAGKQYQGDGLAVAATGAGARLHCVFQKLEGHATRDGLWLVSTTAGAPGGRFRVTAQAVGRAGGAVAPLPGSGTVRAQDTLVRFERPGLTEEYSASLDGIRQGIWGSVCKNQKILPRRQHRHHRNRSLAFWDKAGKLESWDGSPGPCLRPLGVAMGLKRGICAAQAENSAPHHLAAQQSARPSEGRYSKARFLIFAH